MNIKFVTFILLFFLAKTSYAHGMKELGPHSGYIKMPGAFHTELIDKGNEMHVYLIDMNFKNPVVENSSVKIMYRGKEKVNFECTVEKNYFKCPKPTTNWHQFSEISLDSVRNKTQASSAIYTLPLKLDK